MNDIHDDLWDIIFVFVVAMLMALLMLSSWESRSNLQHQIDSGEKVLEFYGKKIHKE